MGDPVVIGIFVAVLVAVIYMIYASRPRCNRSTDDGWRRPDAPPSYPVSKSYTDRPYTRPDSGYVPPAGSYGIPYQGGVYYRTPGGSVYDSSGNVVRDALILGGLAGVAGYLISDALSSSRSDSTRHVDSYVNKAGENSVWGSRDDLVKHAQSASDLPVDQHVPHAAPSTPWSQPAAPVFPVEDMSRDTSGPASFPVERVDTPAYTPRVERVDVEERYTPVERYTPPEPTYTPVERVDSNWNSGTSSDSGGWDSGSSDE